MNKKSREMFVAVLILVVIIISTIFVYISTNNNDGNNNASQNHGEGKTIVLTVQEYFDDGNYETNYTTHVFHNDYKSLSDGDILVIKGEILRQPRYGNLPWWVRNLTHIQKATDLVLGGGAEWPLVIYVSKNVTNVYEVNETVEVTLHIKYYDIYQDYGGETWHIYGELPSEAVFNGQYTLGEIIVPPSQVKKA